MVARTTRDALRRKKKKKNKLVVIDLSKVPKENLPSLSKSLAKDIRYSRMRERGVDVMLTRKILMQEIMLPKTQKKHYAKKTVKLERPEGPKKHLRKKRKIKFRKAKKA